MQPTINHIETFCKSKRITINAGKTQELIITNKTYINNNPLTFQNTKIKPVNEAKFLGITFDKKLNFKKHIKNISTQAKVRSTKLKSLYNQKYGPCKKTMIRLFKIFIRPLFEYGNTAIITISDNNLAEWEQIQTNFIRYILNIPRVSNNMILKLGNVPTIRNRTNQLAVKWFNNLTIKNNTPILNFINDFTKDYKKFDKYKSPHQIIKSLKTLP